MVNELSQNGYKIIRQFIDVELVDHLINAIDDRLKTKSNYGIRNLHHQIPAVNNLANSKLILNTLQKYTQTQNFKLIKAIFFNKNLKHNWSVAWHQDKTIAVENKIILPGFKNWTVKQGLPHVQPPLSILEKITTIRIALDDTDRNNGGLKIIPRSHKLGILNQEKINQIKERQTSLFCSLQAGDALIMHPLILHSSPKTRSNNERRTIHLEYISSD